VIGTEAEADRPLPTLETAVLYGLLGPALGVVPVVVFASLQGGTSVDAEVYGILWVVLLFLSYLLASVPAVLTGIAIAHVSRAIKDGRQIVVASVLTGFVVTALWTLALAMTRDFSWRDWPAVLCFSALGAWAGLGCAAAAVLIRRARTKRKLPSPT